MQSALQGSYGGSTLARNSVGWATVHHNNIWGPGLEEAPPCYNDPAGDGIELLWPELSHMFFKALRYGTPTDVNPYVPAFNETESENWAGRMWTYDKYWVMVCGDRSAIKPASPVEVKLPELPLEARYAYEFNCENLVMRQLPIERRVDGIYMTLDNGFSAVFFPLPNCPPLIETNVSWADFNRGGSTDITITAFSPWESVADPKVNVKMPGIGFSVNDLSLPANLTIPVPAGISTGYYYIDIKGDCLPYKRWFNVSP